MILPGSSVGFIDNNIVVTRCGDFIFNNTFKKDQSPISKLTKTINNVSCNCKNLTDENLP